MYYLNSKVKAVLFFLIVLGLFFQNFLPSTLPFLSTIILLGGTFVFWYTPQTRYPRLTGLIPTSFTLNHIITGIILSVIFYLPYSFLILSDSYDYSSTIGLGQNCLYILQLSINEELIFRGVLFFILARYIRAIPSAIILSTIFAFVHIINPNMEPLAFLNTFLAGFLMSSMAFSTKSLFMPIAFHFSWNIIQGPVLSLPVSGFNYPGIVNHIAQFEGVFWGSNYGPESGLWCTSFLTITIFVVLKYTKSHPNNTSEWFRYLYGEKSHTS